MAFKVLRTTPTLVGDTASYEDTHSAVVHTATTKAQARKWVKDNLASFEIGDMLEIPPFDDERWIVQPETTKVLVAVPVADAAAEIKPSVEA